jgi:hypothetical protein
MKPTRGRFITSHSWVRGDWYSSEDLIQTVARQYEYIRNRFHVEVEFSNGQTVLYKFKRNVEIRSH